MEQKIRAYCYKNVFDAVIFNWIYTRDKKAYQIIPWMNKWKLGF